MSPRGGPSAFENGGEGSPHSIRTVRESGPVQSCHETSTLDRPPWLPAPPRIAASPGAIRPAGRRARRLAGGEPSQHPGHHDGRPAARSDARAAEDPGAARRAGDDLRQQLRRLLALLPLAIDVPHRAVRPQPRRARQRRPARRLSPSRSLEHPARLAPGGGLLHGPRRQVPQQLRGGLPRAAAGVVALVRSDRPLDLPDVPLHGERRRHAGDLWRGAPGLPDGRAGGQGRGDPPLAGGHGPAVLPHRGADRASPGAARPRAVPPASGAPPPGPVRRRGAAARGLVQRGGRRGQARPHQPPPGVHAGETGPHHGDLPGAARHAARRGRPRGAPGQGPRRHRPARPHGDRLHLGQRLLPGRAPGPRGEVPPVRGVDPRPAHHPWRRLPGRGPGGADGLERRSGADDRGPHRRPRPPDDGRPAAAAAGARSQPGEGPDPADRGIRRGEGQAAVPRGARSALVLRRVQERRPASSTISRRIPPSCAACTRTHA